MHPQAGNGAARFGLTRFDQRSTGTSTPTLLPFPDPNCRPLPHPHMHAFTTTATATIVTLTPPPYSPPSPAGEERARLFSAHYYVKPGGNADLSPRSDPHDEFVGKNCLIARQSIQDTAKLAGGSGLVSGRAQGSGWVDSGRVMGHPPRLCRGKKSLFT